MRAEVVKGVLCFAWQDNNTVLGITTAYSPDDLVIRTRKGHPVTRLFGLAPFSFYDIIAGIPQTTRLQSIGTNNEF